LLTHSLTQLNAIETSDNGMLEPELLNDILGDANSLLQEKSRIGSFLSSASTADDGSFNSLYVYENNNVDILRQVDEQKLADSPPGTYSLTCLLVYSLTHSLNHLLTCFQLDMVYLK
jgi:hypothetical protein